VFATRLRLLAHRLPRSARAASVDCKTFYIALRDQFLVELAERVEVSLQGVALNRPLPGKAAQLDRHEGQLDELPQGHSQLQGEVPWVDHDARAAEGLTVGPDIGGDGGHAAR